MREGSGVESLSRNDKVDEGVKGRPSEWFREISGVLGFRKGSTGEEVFESGEKRVDG